MSTPTIEAEAASIFAPRTVVVPEDQPAFPASSIAPPDPALPGLDADDLDALAALDAEPAAPVTGDEPPAVVEETPEPQAKAAPVLHVDKFARKVRQFLAGSDSAREWLLTSKEGQSVVSEYDASQPRQVREAAREQSEADQVFANLKWEQQYNPTAFAQRMANPEWVTFYAEMAQQGTATDPEPAAPPSDMDELLAPTLERLRAREGSALLTAEDWAQLDPEHFEDRDPEDAKLELAALHTRLVARRVAAAKRAPVAAQAAQLRQEDAAVARMQRAAAPVVAGATSPPRTREQVRAEWHAAYEQAAQGGPRIPLALDAEWRRMQSDGSTGRSEWWN